MSVYLCIPSIRPSGGTVPLWLAKGYRVCLVRQGAPVDGAINLPTDHYLGWAASINKAVAHVLSIDPEAEWFVGGGDDTEPSEVDPQSVAAECAEHFGGTFGVMQPIGDLALWPASKIDTFAGSPWMGREWCERAHQGRGPVDDRFHHMFGDESLMNVAIKYGAFWQRADLIHKHMHALRDTGPGALPDFLKPVNTSQHWNESQLLFNRLKAEDWPGCEPSPMVAA